MSIIQHARDEMKRVNFNEDEAAAVIEVMELFFKHWDSGGAVAVMLPMLVRMMEGKPLTPLSGKQEEWVIHDFDADCYAQNKRCGTVFRRKDGTSYDIASGSRVEISFPYYPKDRELDL
jgi:hypothetical protein